jgi:hypothetical protein
MTGLELLYCGWQGISGLLKMFGSIIGLWAPVTVAVVKTDFNSLFSVISFVTMFIAVLLALVYIFRILATSCTQITTVISNVSASPSMIAIALVPLLILVCLSHLVIINFIRLADLLLTATLYICSHTVGAAHYFGEIAGANQPAIAN